MNTDYTKEAKELIYLAARIGSSWPHETHKSATKSYRELDTVLESLQALLVRAEKSGYEKGVKDSSAIVLRRTEIPKDAKNPTRDAVVELGKELSRLILATLQGEKSDE